MVCWPTLLLDHAMFIEFAEGLDGSFRCLLIDPPGWGLNRDLVIPQALPDLLRVATSLLDGLDIERCHWVGLGLGGQLGVLAQHKTPQRFLTMTYLSMPLIRAARVTLVAQVLRRVMLCTAMGRRKVVDQICSQMGYASEAEAAKVHAQVHAAVDQCNPKVLQEASPTPQHELDNLRVALKRSAVPSLFLAGQHDRACLPRDQQTAAQLVAISQFITVDTGFFSVLARAKLCAEHFKSFVQQHASERVPGV